MSVSWGSQRTEKREHFQIYSKFKTTSVKYVNLTNRTMSPNDVMLARQRSPARFFTDLAFF